MTPGNYSQRFALIADNQSVTSLAFALTTSSYLLNRHYFRILPDPSSQFVQRIPLLGRLDLTQALQVVAGFDRPNIRYRIEAKAEPRKQLLTLKAFSERDAEAAPLKAAAVP